MVAMANSDSSTPVSSSAMDGGKGKGKATDFDDTPHTPSTLPAPSTGGERVLKVAIHTPFADGVASVLTLPPSSTILDLKQKIHNDFTGNPKIDGIKIINGGRSIPDHEVLGTLFNSDGADDTIHHVHATLPPTTPAPFASNFTFSSPPPLNAPVPVHPNPISPEPHPLLSSLSSSTYPPLGGTSNGPAFVSPNSSSAPPLSSQPQSQTHPTPSTSTDQLLNWGEVPAPQPAFYSGRAGHANQSGEQPRYSTGPAAANSRLPNYNKFISSLQNISLTQRLLIIQRIQRAEIVYARALREYQHSQANSAMTGMYPASLVQDGNSSLGGDEELRQKITVDTVIAGETEKMLKAVEIWDWVESEVSRKKKAERAKEWKDGGGPWGGPKDWKVVQINSLPYLLYTPPGQRKPFTPDHILSSEAIHTILVNMLAIANIVQSVEASYAARSGPDSRLPLPPWALTPTLGGTGGLGAQLGGINFGGGGAGGAGAGAGGAAAHRELRNHLRRATDGGNAWAIVINLNALAGLLIPLTMLSLKLGFLFWIFARHASPAKRVLLAVISAAYVIYEGYTLHRRRIDRAMRTAGLNFQQRVARARDGAADPGIHGGEGVDAFGDGLPRPPAGQDDAADGAGGGNNQPLRAERLNRVRVRRLGPRLNAIVPGPGDGRLPRPDRRERDRTPVPAYRRYSMFTPKYWIMLMASINLFTEARELQIPLSSRSPVIPPPLTARENTPLRRVLRTTLTAFVLFLGTLIPEVEKRRKKALEKRERLILIRAIQDQQRRHAAMAASASQAQAEPGITAQSSGALSASNVTSTLAISSSMELPAAAPATGAPAAAAVHPPDPGVPPNLDLPEGDLDQTDLTPRGLSPPSSVPSSPPGTPPNPAVELAPADGLEQGGEGVGEGNPAQQPFDPAQTDGPGGERPGPRILEAEEGRIVDDAVADLFLA